MLNKMKNKDHPVPFRTGFSVFSEEMYRKPGIFFTFNEYLQGYEQEGQYMDLGGDHAGGRSGLQSLCACL